MPVPAAISDLSQTAASNSPAGSESPSLLDDYQRTLSAFIAMHRDGAGFTQEATVASGATTDIGAATSFYVQITGTTTITSFGTAYNGPRFVRFAGALTLTHNATTLILPGGANITTAAGDTCVVVPSGNAANGWRVISYQRAATSPVWTYSSGASGYQKLPSGLILQWGSVGSLSSSADTTITFPIAFPTAADFFMVSHDYSAGSGSIAYCAGTQTSTTQAVARSSTNGLGAVWIALGY